MSRMQIHLNFELIKNKVKYTVRVESVMEDKGCSGAVYMLIKAKMSSKYTINFKKKNMVSKVILLFTICITSIGFG